MCVAAGVDAIGLNFYQPSPRSLTADQAREIVSAVGDEIQLVGLFVNESIETILRLHDELAFDFIQLHGDEDPFYLKQLAHLPLIRALRCRDTEPTSLIDYLAACTTFDISLEALLLDAYQPGSYGGTGHQLDWKSFPDFTSHFRGYDLILAGGITDENVTQAISLARPDAVDTASGVESEPGKKDAAKVSAFASRAIQAFEEIR